MAARDIVVIILAAGKGTRLRSNLTKVLHRAGGRTLVEHVVRACQSLGAGGVYVVVGHQAEDVRAVVTPLGAQAVLQEQQRGTGHAILVARNALPKGARLAIVVPGDAPLVRTDTLAELVQAHRAGRAAATILTAKLEDPTGYGRIVLKKNGAVAAIVEQSAASKAERAIREINSSIYCFTLEKLWPCLKKLKPHNVHRELYLTDAIAVLNQRGEKVLGHLIADPQEILGCNTRAELAEVDRLMRRRKTAALMQAGVTIYLPETVLIDPDVEIGCDTVIEPCVQLLGKTRLGSGCTIRTGSVIADSVLEDEVVVEPHCVVAASRLGNRVILGPFARLRPEADLRAGAKVGNFVEVKKTVLGEGARAMHLTYLGDAVVGSKTNVGAGTITCNYDGVTKHPTTIGERAFIGSDTTLVAPVKIGDGAYVAAGSTITEDVPADALAVARGRQVNKPGWAAERRANTAPTASEQTTAKAAAAGSANAGGGNPGHHRAPNKPTRRKSSPRKKKSRRSRR